MEDEEDPIEQHLLFNQMFEELYSVDSTRVEDFYEMLETSVVYLVNLK